MDRPVLKRPVVDAPTASTAWYVAKGAVVGCEYITIATEAGGGRQNWRGEEGDSGRYRGNIEGVAPITVEWGLAVI